MIVRFASPCGLDENGEYRYYGAPPFFDDVSGLEIVDGPSAIRFGRRVNPRDPFSADSGDPREVYEIIARTPPHEGGRQSKPFGAQ